MRFKQILIGMLAVLALAAGLPAAAQQTQKLPPINVKQYKLKNGLTVLMHEDHSTPIVAVNMWYHVGSKNEAPGRTGFAHLFEHMMFQGSGNYIDGWRAVDELGGNVNGTTNEDRTYYYEAIPSNFLERTLYMEADRMGNLLAAMDQAKLDNQRDVVKNERRFRVDNVPYGTMSERIDEIIYPEDHPYHHSVIGSMADLSAASLDDVKSFFRQYYVPNNTYLVLSGDFNEKQAKQWIDKYFGKIKAGAAINRPSPPMPQLSSIIRKQYEDPFAQLSRVALVWPGVRQYHQDEAALDILANILSTGRGSRLQSNLVYGKELAQQVFASDGTSEIGGEFQINAIARPGKALDEVEQEINKEIERLKKDGVTADEVSRAVSAREAQAIYGLQTVLGKGGRLADYVGYVGKPNYFQQDLDRYLKVTPEDVKRVANQYLVANHIVMSYVPAKTPPPPAAADKPASTETKKKDTALIAKQDAMLPKGGPDPKFTLPAIEKSQLSNGLNLWVVQQHELPIVSMNLVVNAGGIAESADKSGVASMTASMLTMGTKNRSALEISNSLQAIGAQVGGGANWDNSGVSMQTITKNLDKALDIYADVVTNASFPEQEFAQLKRRTLANFLQRKASATAVAGVVYDKVLYGDQPYGRQLTGDENTVKGLSRGDLQSFYASNYIPNNSTLIVVGDVQPADIKARLERAFANWKPGTVKAVNVGSQHMEGKPAIYLVDKPGAAQSSVNIGIVGIERSNPDYYAVQVMNSILGGGGTARLFMNLREDKGYTYGAYSRFSPRRGPGPFSASGEIQTISTKEAVQEFLKEINGIRGSRPVTAQELEVNKQSFIRRYPSAFETVGGISNQLANLVTYNLPDSYFNDYIRNINAVTIDDVNRVANKYLDPSRMAIVIVGDRKVVEPGLKELGYPITYLDTEGKVLTQ
jgi:zinc protease